ncbi:MAG: hypothetical protein GX123_05340 [Clostridiales bacterium]|jgi:hypothetical protein|nr:hypothetical protein [Eubacteriales bacterium]NLO15451.1 hypothetical protein [Clostridiales bacterium]
MTEKYLYPSLLDKRINDGVKAYCRAEGLDEKYFRCYAEKKSSIMNMLRTIRLKQKHYWQRVSDFFIT